MYLLTRRVAYEQGVTAPPKLPWFWSLTVTWSSTNKLTWQEVPTGSSLRHSAHTTTWITLKVKASIKQFPNRAIFKVPCYPWLATVGKEHIYYWTRSEANFLFMQPLACAHFQIFLANIALILSWNNLKNKKRPGQSAASFLYQSLWSCQRDYIISCEFMNTYFHSMHGILYRRVIIFLIHFTFRYYNGVGRHFVFSVSSRIWSIKKCHWLGNLFMNWPPFLFPL